MANEGPAPANQKKKRIDEDEETTHKAPLQLQRRRVWRACESCRFCPFSDFFRSFIVLQAQEDQVRWLRAHLQPMFGFWIAMHLVADQG